MRLLSFVIPAHDERALIEPTIRAIHAAAQAAEQPYEIVVVDDASSDGTGAIAADAGARVVRAELRQISAARNAGAAAARGAAFVFVDADTLVNTVVVRGIVRALERGAAGGGAAVRFDEPTPRYARVLLCLGLWCFRRLRLAAGCCLFCTRQAFEAASGFDEELFAGEEAVLSRALGQQGRFVLLREAVVTSGRKLRAFSAWRILGMLARLACAGRKGLRDRQRLGLWYGPRC